MPGPGIALPCPSELCPVLPIGAKNLPGKISVKGRRLRRSPGDATGESALDGDPARREDAWYGGRATSDFVRCGAECSVTGGHHRLSGSGANRHVGVAPVRASAREGAAWPEHSVSGNDELTLPATDGPPGPVTPFRAM